jgi:hypothetical protein
LTQTQTATSLSTEVLAQSNDSVVDLDGSTNDEEYNVIIGDQHNDSHSNGSAQDFNIVHRMRLKLWVLFLNSFSKEFFQQIAEETNHCVHQYNNSKENIF